MRTEFRTLAVAVSLVMLLTGPLAPLANAQQPAPTEPAPAQPAPTQPAPTQTMEMKPDTSGRAAESAAYNIGAGVANVFYVPGKVALCGLGGLVGVAVMIVSIGSAPRTAAGFAREGCGGKWVLTGDDLKPEADARTFDWEKDRSY